MRNTVINELTRMAQTDDRMVLITGDLGYSVLEGFEKNFPERYINAGIAEDGMTSVAAGIALSGKIVFTYSIGNFNTLRCMEQLRNDVCYHQANVKVLSVGGGFSYGQLGMSHHSTEDIAMMRELPHMRVYVPADPEEAVAALHDAVAYSGPCYIRIAKRGEPNLYAKGSSYDVTQIHELRAGTDVCLLGCGPMLGEVCKAADLLYAKGISTAVYSVPCIKPLDTASIKELATRVELLVTVEEHQNIGGLGGAVAETVSALRGIRAPLLRLGLNDEFTSIVGSHDYLCEQYGLSGRCIAARVREALA